MFSIPAAGLAQSLMAVTISMHPATAHHYTVRSGDTLSAIAHHEYGKTADWPAIWWANRHQISNPNLISAGARLRLPGSGPGRHGLVAVQRELRREHHGAGRHRGPGVLGQRRELVRHRGLRVRR